MHLRTLFGSSARDSHSADALEAEYVNWRKEAQAVTESYESWARASRDERWLAYAAYLIALDREEHAACTYRSIIRQVGTRPESAD